ncbi:MAG TPA: NAD(P)-dependent alcohol dehydrogenase [Microthrixaceae bacterium]|nr:NAD(P)-dependent alcohol dehydrogenase [Microthrixaceae bacterium]
MRAFQLTDPGEAEVRDVDQPQPRAGEVLVKVTGAGVCHSDLHILHAEEALFPTPMTFGHEVAGTIVGIGEGVLGWEEGTPVLVHPCWGCGRCRNCAVGAENYCETFPRGTTMGPGLGADGGWAEYVAVPNRHVVPLGDLDPVLAAPLTDAGLTPYHAISLSRPRLEPTSTVVVIGVGGLGHMAIQILRATSGVRIVAVDTDEQRLGRATELGADFTLMSDERAADEIMRITGGVGADAVFDFVGVTPTLTTALACIGNRGEITAVGLGAGEIAFRPEPVGTYVPWGTTIRKPYGGTRRDLQEVVNLAQRGMIDVHVDRFDLTDAAQALERLEQGEVSGRAVLVP